MDVFGFKDVYLSKDFEVQSPATEYIWQEINKCKCDKQYGYIYTSEKTSPLPHVLDKPPAENCICGFHATYSLASHWFPNNRLTMLAHYKTIVRAWGKVIFHEMGFRAEYMTIVAWINGYLEIHKYLPRYMRLADLTDDAVDDKVKQLGNIYIGEQISREDALYLVNKTRKEA